jgi:hypothetical protein
MTRFFFASLTSSLLAPTLCAAGEGNAQKHLLKRKRVNPETPEERVAQTPKPSGAAKSEPTHKKEGSNLSPLGDGTGGNAKLAKAVRDLGRIEPKKQKKKPMTTPSKTSPCGRAHGAWVECAACETERNWVEKLEQSTVGNPQDVDAPESSSVLQPTYQAPPIALSEPSAAPAADDKKRSSTDTIHR